MKNEIKKWLKKRYDRLYEKFGENEFDFEKALEKWINDYNTDLPHQSLNNLTPEQFRQKYEEQIYEPILP